MEAEIKRKMLEIDFNHYLSDDGYVMQRETCETPSGYVLHETWIYRTPDGKLIDYAYMRFDLAYKNNLELVY